MSRTVRACAALVMVSATAILAGCGSDDSPTPPSAESMTAESMTDSAPPSTTAALVADADRCATGELSVNEGRADGSAGSVTIPLVFTNTGGRTCTLYGFPGVSYVDHDEGTEVGAAATRSGDIGEPAVLAPGGRATATVRAVQVLNYPTEQCHPTPVAGLRVYPPNDTSTLFVGHAGTGCAGHEVGQLEVTAIHLPSKGE